MTSVCVCVCVEYINTQTHTQLYGYLPYKSYACLTQSEAIVQYLSLIHMQTEIRVQMYL